MKARVKDTGQILEVMTVKLENGFYYSVNRLEIESNNASDHWQDVRERAAMMALSSIIPMTKGLYSMCDAHKKYNDCAKEAISYADALVKELKGE